MAKLLFTLLVGVIAGIIDIVPMILQKLDRYSIISAFVQWIIVAFVITYIQLGVTGWVKGLLIAVLLALPIIILVMKTDPQSAVPILVMSAILGSLVGFLSGKIIK